MSESSQPPRPRQVTLAGWLVMVGSVVVVGLVFQRIAGLHTLATRDSVQSFLADSPGSDLGVGVDGVLSIIRTLAMVAAGCATAAGILGYHVLRRSRAARLGLTVVAVPLFLTGMILGGFVSALVAASAVMLWLQPARDWFNGVTRPTPTRAPAATPPPVTGPPVTGPSPFSGYAPLSQSPFAPQPPPAWPGPHPAAAVERPGAVLWACVLTWVFSAFTALAMIAGVVTIAVSPHLMFDEVHRQNPELAQEGVSNTMLAAVTYVMAGAIVLWCVAAAVLGVLVLRRVPWARIVLVVSASCAAALCLVGSAVGAFLLVLPLVGSVVTLALLVRPDVRPWFDRPAA